MAEETDSETPTDSPTGLPASAGSVSNEEHHIWCNRIGNKPPSECRMCLRLKESYPQDCSPDELVKRHFPTVIVRTSQNPKLAD